MRLSRSHLNRSPLRSKQRGFINIALRRGWLGNPFNPLDLFRAGEQGAWYDPSDFSSMYQDASAQTPVTALEQPVGWLGDKRLGFQRGAEINGDPNLNGGWWSANAGITVGSGKVSYAAAATGNALHKTAQLTAGKTYEVSITIANWVAGGVQFECSSGTAPAISGIFSANGTYTTRLRADNTTIYLASRGGPTTLDVTKISIKEVLGNHASQSTASSRPVVSARFNLWTNSEFPNGLADAPTRGPLVTDGGASIAGYAGSLAFGYNGTNAAYAYKSDYTAVVGVSYLVTAVIKMDDGGAPVPGGTTAGYDFYFTIAGGAPAAGAYTVTPLGGGAYRVSASAAATGANGNIGVFKTNTNSSRTFKVTAYDLRFAADANLSLPPYQRITTASSYDSVGYPIYLKTDGFDDGMVTNSIDFTGTDKMTVFAAVTKLSDAAAAMAAELSATATGNAGAWYLSAPISAAPNVRFLSGGTSNQSSNNGSIAAPASAVFTGVASISAPSVELRTNGVSNGVTALTQGTGTFGNYPLYLFRRGGSSLPFTGRTFGLLVRGAASTPSQIANGERWFGRKAALSF